MVKIFLFIGSAKEPGIRSSKTEYPLNRNIALFIIFLILTQYSIFVRLVPILFFIVK